MKLKKNYKKIFDAIMAGHTVVLDVGSGDDARMRVVTKNECFYGTYKYNEELRQSCFNEGYARNGVFLWKKYKGLELVEEMQRFDESVNRQIKQIHIMK